MWARHPHLSGVYIWNGEEPEREVRRRDKLWEIWLAGSLDLILHPYRRNMASKSEAQSLAATLDWKDSRRW